MGHVTIAAWESGSQSLDEILSQKSDHVVSDCICFIHTELVHIYFGLLCLVRMAPLPLPLLCGASTNGWRCWCPCMTTLSPRPSGSPPMPVPCSACTSVWLRASWPLPSPSSSCECSCSLGCNAVIYTCFASPAGSCGWRKRRRKCSICKTWGKWVRWNPLLFINISAQLSKSILHFSALCRISLVPISL